MTSKRIAEVMVEEVIFDKANSIIMTVDLMVFINGIIRKYVTLLWLFTSHLNKTEVVKILRLSAPLAMFTKKLL